MVAKGKDVSHLFPSVVKNVVSKNQEVGAALHVVYCLHMCYVWCVCVCNGDCTCCIHTIQWVIG